MEMVRGMKKKESHSKWFEASSRRSREFRHMLCCRGPTSLSIPNAEDTAVDDNVGLVKISLLDSHYDTVMEEQIVEDALPSTVALRAR